MSVASMISVEDARAHVLAGLVPTAPEIVALAEGWGRVLATDIVARLSHPPHDVSAMDGFAVIAADPGPRRIVGTAPAGHPWRGHLQAGEALRLFTGSVVPQGADAVAIQEDATWDHATVTLRDPARPGSHIRRAGQDFRAGDALVRAGTRLGPRQIGLIAAGNHAWVSVHRRPVVAILATGDEIVLPGEPVGEGGIVSSNSHALAALVRACGGTPAILPIAADDRGAIARAAAGATGCDLLVTTGGASVGAHDLVAEALGPQGLALDFWKVAMRPGKPLMSGRLGRLPLLGLPGNPVSAYICALLFLGPAIERLLSLPGDAPRPVPARLGADLAANDHRADHLRCSLSPAADGTLLATPSPRQDSGMIRVLAESDGVILRPPHAPAAVRGESVPVLRL